MSLRAISGTDFLASWCPIWFALPPEKTHPDQTIKGDWCSVTLMKRDHQGNLISSLERPDKFKYTQEISSGDLYGLQDKKSSDKPGFIAFKAALMFFAIPFYLFGMVAVNTMRIVVDSAIIFRRAIQQFLSHFSTKSILASLGNMILSVAWEAPTAVLQDIWRIARSPIYALGMQWACLFAIVSPYEGRKWLGEIELAWHEGMPYQMDLRHGKSAKEIDKTSLSEWISSIYSGKIYFLGYCMPKRGNMSERVNGKPRFEFYKENNLTTIPKSQSSSLSQFFYWNWKKASTA